MTCLFLTYGVINGGRLWTGILMNGGRLRTGILINGGRLWTGILINGGRLWTGILMNFMMFLCQTKIWKSETLEDF